MHRCTIIHQHTIHRPISPLQTSIQLLFSQLSILVIVSQPHRPRGPGVRALTSMHCLIATCRARRYIVNANIMVNYCPFSSRGYLKLCFCSVDHFTGWLAQRCQSLLCAVESSARAHEGLPYKGPSCVNGLCMIMFRRVVLFVAGLVLLACVGALMQATTAFLTGFLLYFLHVSTCLLYTSPSPRDATLSRMPSSA